MRNIAISSPNSSSFTRMDRAIVVYRTFTDPMLANIMLTKLRDAGFNCFLSGENTVNLGFLFESPLGEVQLHVFEDEVLAIQDFLDDDNTYGR